MYQELNHRPSTANSPKPFSVDLSSIQLDERAAYVNSVCAALIDSRFEIGRSKSMFIDIRKLPELEPAVFYELTVDGPFLPHPEMARRYLVDAIRCELARAGFASAPIRCQSRSPSTLGRGSPQRFQGRKTFAISKGKNH